MLVLVQNKFACRIVNDTDGEMGTLPQRITTALASGTTEASTKPGPRHAPQRREHAHTPHSAAMRSTQELH